MSEPERPPGFPGPVRRRRPEDFDASYTGTPPWDIGRPQPAFLELAEASVIRGRVLDVGCGTGEHALMAAGRGLEATGIDTASTAIAIAQDKARKRGITARFLVWNALQLGALDDQFDTVLDCGLFHVFEDDERASSSIPSGPWLARAAVITCFASVTDIQATGDPGG
jgi:2-polyprenyl-3-methyl-5-hydroxy-6-metoxy-1,4-benzoquinol methylase